MLINLKNNILIVGLGLMGGSYAMALKKFGFTVNALNKDIKSIEYAIHHGYIDNGSDKVDEKLIGDANIIIFALYPHDFINWIKENQKYIKKNTLLTDVTGVKSRVVKEIQSILRDDIEFVPAHPMAGREASGIEYATDKVFQGANYIVTPTDKNTEPAIEIVMQLGRILGFKNINRLSLEEHDDMIGFVSQLTHCIAVSLMTCRDNTGMEKYTGDSFRDLTRIAKINDAMWPELFVENKSALLKEMTLFQEQFDKLKTYIEKEDFENMRKMMRKSTESRIKFDK